MKKIVLLIVALALITGVVLAQNVTDQAMTTQETPAVQVTTAPIPDTLTQGQTMSLLTAVIWVIIFFIIGILLVFPWIMNTWWNIKVRKLLMNEIAKIQDPKEKERYYDKLLDPIPERKGMSRFALMVAVTMIVGAVVLYLVIIDPKNDLLKTIVGVLTGGLTSIIGFYFGGGGAMGSKGSGEETPKGGEKGSGAAGGGAAAPAAGQPSPYDK